MMWNCERTGEDVFKCPCTVVSLKLVYVRPYVEDIDEHGCVFEYIDLSTKISFWFQLNCTLADSKYVKCNKLYQHTCQTNQDATEKCVLQLRAQLKHKRRPSRNNVFVPEFRIYTHNRVAPQRHWWLVVEFTEFRVWFEHKPRWGSWWGTEVHASLPPSVRLVVVRGGLSVQVVLHHWWKAFFLHAVGQHLEHQAQAAVHGLKVGLDEDGCQLVLQ